MTSVDAPAGFTGGARNFHLRKFPIINMHKPYFGMRFFSIFYFKLLVLLKLCNKLNKLNFEFVDKTYFIKRKQWLVGTIIQKQYVRSILVMNYMNVVNM